MRYNDFKLVEYVDPEEAKKEILTKVQEIDPNDEENQALLDKVYSIVHQTGVTDRLMPTLEGALKQEYNEKAIKIIAERMVMAPSLNLQQKKQFLENLKQDKCVNHELFLKTGHFSLDELFMGDPVNKQMFMEFINFGEGQKRAGKGEHAFAILSQQITQKGLGDLDVKGVPVELKVAATKGSGRLGEGGVNPEKARQIIAQFEDLTDALNAYSMGGHQGPTEFIKSARGTPDKPQKSVNLVDFTRICNALELEQDRRQQIGKAVFNDRFGKFGDTITEVFQQPGAAPKAVLDAYIKANFEFYKASEGGGAWQTLTSIAVGANSGVTAASGEELAKLNANGALGSSIPAIIPTQDPEVFYQVNPSVK
jgi:hypothetical protein